MNILYVDRHSMIILRTFNLEVKIQIFNLLVLTQNKKMAF